MRVELRVEAPLGAAQLETQVVVPIEMALRGLEGLAHVRAEIVEGRARIELELDRASYGAAMDEIRSRMSALQVNLPPEVRAPRPYEISEVAAWLSYVLESETHDLNALAAAVEQLEQQLRTQAGVVRVERCAPQAQLFVELEPARLAAYGLDPSALVEGLRQYLDASEEAVEIGQLRRYAHVDKGRELELATLAGFRVSFRNPSCIAAGPRGVAATLRAELAGTELAPRLDAQVQRGVDSLPQGISLRPSPSQSTRMMLSLAPGISLQEGAELLGGGFGRDASSWLVEVGVEGEPCWGTGPVARLTLPLGTAAADIAEALREHEGVDALDEGRAEPLRVWVTDQPEQSASSAARTLASELRELEGVARVERHGALTGGEPELVFDLDLIEAAGLELAQLEPQLALLDGISLGEIQDGKGGRLEGVVRLGAADQERSDTQLVVRGELLSATQLARVERRQEPALRCRWDGKAAVLLSVWPSEDRAALARKLEAREGGAFVVQ